MKTPSASPALPRRIKRAVQDTFPKIYHFLRWQFGHPAHYKRVADAVVERLGQRVVAGPFQGMEYVGKAAGSAYIPKLLGCYELEMHPWIHRAIAADYRTIIDVGCAEGYYAVGLARACPHAKVFAFDGDSDARALCQSMAELNAVDDRVAIEGYCTPERLASLPVERTLLVCDVDGYEAELLQPELVASLRRMDILLELHEPLRPGITSTILGRFQDTHEVSILDALEREPSQHPLVSFLPVRDQLLAITESRPPGQQYAYFEVKDRHGEPRSE